MATFSVLQKLAQSKRAAWPLGLVCALALQACGRGGTARFEWEPIGDEQAVSLLEREAARPDRVETIIARVENSAPLRAGVGDAPALGQNTNPNFNYRRFWRGLRGSRAFRQLNLEQQQRLLSLHGRACGEADFQEFARLVLELDARHLEFILGEYRHCQQSLNPELTRDFLLRLFALRPLPPLASPAPPAPLDPEDPLAGVGRGGVSERADIGGPQARRQPPRFQFSGEPGPEPAPPAQTQISRFVAREILRNPTQTGWEILACFLTESDAAAVAASLGESGQAELGQRILTVQRGGCYF